MEADGFGDCGDGIVRLAQAQGGLFETVFDEIIVRRRRHAGAERAQAGGLAAVRARGEVVERDIFGVMRRDIVKDLLGAEGVGVLLFFRGRERRVRAQEQDELEKMQQDAVIVKVGRLRCKGGEFLQQMDGVTFPRGLLRQRAERQRRAVEDAGDVVIGGQAGQAGQKAQLVGGIEQVVIMVGLCRVDAVDDALAEERALALRHGEAVFERLDLDRAVGDVEELQVIMPMHDMEAGIGRRRLAVQRFADAIGKGRGSIRIFCLEVGWTHRKPLLSDSQEQMG